MASNVTTTNCVLNNSIGTLSIKNDDGTYTSLGTGTLTTATTATNSLGKITTDYTVPYVSGYSRDITVSPVNPGYWTTTTSVDWERSPYLKVKMPPEPNKLFDITLNAKEYVDYIEKIIVNNKAVIVLWKDKSKTTAVVQGNDEFDLERGIEICIFKRIFGSCYHALIKAGMKKYHELEEQKQKEIDLKQAEKLEKEVQELKRQRAEKQERDEKTYVISEGIKRALEGLTLAKPKDMDLDIDENEWNEVINNFLKRCGV